jgi:hypothetical protein
MKEKLNYTLENILQQSIQDNRDIVARIQIDSSQQFVNNDIPKKNHEFYLGMLQNKRHITAKIIYSVCTKLNIEKLDIEKINDDLADIAVEYFRLALIIEPDEEDCQRIIKILRLAEIDTSLNHVISLIDVFLADAFS